MGSPRWIQQHALAGGRKTEKEGERERVRDLKRCLFWMDGTNNGSAVLPSQSCREVILSQRREKLHWNGGFFFPGFLSDFDPRLWLGGTGGLPNFDQCGRNPLPCNPSHLSLCLKPCDWPYISPPSPPLSHPLPFYVFICLFFLLFTFYLRAIYEPHPSSPLQWPPAVVCWGGHMGGREKRCRVQGLKLLAGAPGGLAVLLLSH